VRVSHLGFSLSVFRFDRASATLAWDHDAPSKSKLSASVATSSIATNVAGFAAQLTGDKFLNSAAHPSATFVSSAFRQVDATHGKVDGQFTLMGRTKPTTFDVTLIGAGPGFAGGPVMGHVIGVEATTSINPPDYRVPAIFTEPIEITIDAEFDKKPK
jgi:polyisoprenoid-binding protein YceI